jgi:hypothetical protein
VLIDDSYENLTLHAKGSQFIKTPALGETYVPYFTFSVPMIGGMPPAIAIRCESRDMGMHIVHSVISGNNYVVTVLWQPNIPNGDDGVLYWYAFYPTSKTSRGTGVVVLRNRNTNIVTFDSDLKYLRVVDVISGSSETTANYPAGRTYASMAMRIQYRCRRTTCTSSTWMRGVGLPTGTLFLPAGRGARSTFGTCQCARPTRGYQTQWVESGSKSDSVFGCGCDGLLNIGSEYDTASYQIRRCSQ